MQTLHPRDGHTATGREQEVTENWGEDKPINGGMTDLVMQSGGRVEKEKLILTANTGASHCRGKWPQ